MRPSWSGFRVRVHGSEIGFLYLSLLYPREIGRIHLLGFWKPSLSQGAARTGKSWICHEERPLMRQHAVSASALAAAGVEWRSHSALQSSYASGFMRRGSKLCCASCCRPQGHREPRAPVGAACCMATAWHLHGPAWRMLHGTACCCTAPAEMDRQRRRRRSMLCVTAAGKKQCPTGKDADQQQWPLEEDEGQQQWEMQDLLRRCFVRSLVGRIAEASTCSSDGSAHPQAGRAGGPKTTGEQGSQGGVDGSAHPRLLSRYVSQTVLCYLPLPSAHGLCPTIPD